MNIYLSWFVLHNEKKIDLFKEWFEIDRKIFKQLIINYSINKIQVARRLAIMEVDLERAEDRAEAAEA